MKRAFTLIEAIIVTVIILILAALLFPMFATDRHAPSRRSMCQSDLKQIGLGFMQYVQDYDERFPPARVTSSIGWADVLQPYIKSTQVFQCPSATNSAPPLTDYFYNRRLARLPQQTLESSAQTILSGDGEDDAPTWNSIAQLPRAWTQTSTSPSRRHLDMANYLFADGHVKALKPSKITVTSPARTSNWTFASR